MRSVSRQLRRFHAAGFTAAVMTGAALFVAPFAAWAAGSAPVVPRATPAPLPPGAADAYQRIMQQLSPAQRSVIHALGVRLNDALKMQPLADPEALATAYVNASNPPFTVYPGSSATSSSATFVFPVLMDAASLSGGDLTSGSPNFSIGGGDLSAVQQNLQGQLDSMNEMSEATAMRLQLTMDRRRKLVTAVTNVLPRIVNPNNAVIRNLK